MLLRWFALDGNQKDLFTHQNLLTKTCSQRLSEFSNGFTTPPREVVAAEGRGGVTRARRGS